MSSATVGILAAGGCDAQGPLVLEMAYNLKSAIKRIPGARWLYRRIRELIFSLGYWVFDNGVKVYKRHFTTYEISRYKMLKLKHLNFHEPEEEEFFAGILREYDGEGVFVDIGAHVGYYCFLARRLSSRIEIHAFNPDTQCVRMMKETMQLNNIYDIHIHSQAISDSVGRCDIAPGSPGARITQGGNIVKTTIDNFLGSLNSDVYLMKMDIQGEELNALRGARKSFSRIRNMIIGTHGQEIHRKCLNVLVSHGYDIPFESPSVENQPDGIVVAKLQKLASS